MLHVVQRADIVGLRTEDIRGSIGSGAGGYHAAAPSGQLGGGIQVSFLDHRRPRHVRRVNGKDGLDHVFVRGMQHLKAIETSDGMDYVAESGRNHRIAIVREESRCPELIVVDLDPECFLDDRRGAFETDSQAVGIAMGDPKTLAVAQSTTACSSCTDGENRAFHSSGVRNCRKFGDPGVRNSSRNCCSSAQFGGWRPSTTRSIWLGSKLPARVAEPFNTSNGVGPPGAIFCWPSAVKAPHASRMGKLKFLRINGLPSLIGRD